MATPRKPRPLCRHCGAREVSEPRRPYCGRKCAGLARQKRVAGSCAHCGSPVERRPSELGATGDLFCSHAHYLAWLQSRERPTFECRQCHAVKPLPAWAKAQTYCSNRCSGLAKRTRVARTCPVCSTSFEAEPNEITSGRGKYCRSACRYEGRRRSCAAEKPCARAGCSQPIRGNRTQVAKRRYCSPACRLEAAGGAPVVIICARDGCTNRRRVSGRLVERGFGKFCGMGCYAAARREARPVIRCAWRACRHKRAVQPSNAGQRFCSRACFNLSRRPGSFRCPVCKKVELRKAGRRPKFCSYVCRNRGRTVKLAPREPDRNARILVLRAQGLKAPAIQRVLADENPSWWMSPVAIRQVISRAR